jgi:hypothetical protein
VDPQPLVAAGLAGAELGQRLTALRIEAIAAACPRDEEASRAH